MVLILTQKAVLYHPPHDKMHKKGFMISFDTIFQILRPKYNPETKSFGPSHGIKFHCPNFEAQEFYNDNREYYNDRQEWYEDAWRRGAFISATSWRTVGCANVVYVNGIRYYDCNGVRYEQVYHSGQVTYVIVN